MATLRVRKALKNIGNYRTEEQALVKADYSPSYARSGLIKKTKGWNELVDKYISDNELAIRHSEQLNSSKLTKLYFDIDDSDEMIEAACKKLGVDLLYIKINKDKTGKTVNVKAPDFFFRDLALDKGYKLKGRYNNSDDPNREKPAPILKVVINNVRIHHSDEKDRGDDEASESSAGGDISVKDSLDHPLLDSLSTIRPEADTN